MGFTRKSYSIFSTLDPSLFDRLEFLNRCQGVDDLPMLKHTKWVSLPVVGPWTKLPGQKLIILSKDVSTPVRVMLDVDSNAPIP